MTKFTGDISFEDEILMDDIDFEASLRLSMWGEFNETETDFDAQVSEEDARREIMAH